MKLALKLQNPVTAINGFRKCGIVPFDSDIFSEADFLAAKDTHQHKQTEKSTRRNEHSR
jgi:hypothetical protein